MKPIILKWGYSIDCLTRLGIYYEYEKLVELEKLGLFPKQVGPFMWDANQIVDWLEHNRDGLPSKPERH